MTNFGLLQLFRGMKTYTSFKEVDNINFTDKEGKPLSWHEFKKQADALNVKYNEHYLKTEYQFAATSAQNVDKWEQLEEDSILQYRTAEDDKVRDEHQALAGTTLPASDRFWNEYYPPNGWNCRCVAVEVRAGKYKISDSKEAIQKGHEATTKFGKDGRNQLDLFRFNPGKEKKIFPDKHPYTSGSCDKLKAVWHTLTARQRMELANEGNKCRALKIIRDGSKENEIKYKQEIYALPLGKQYIERLVNDKGHKLYLHQTYSQDKELYRQEEYVAKAWVKNFKDVRMQPKIHVSEKEARSKLLPNLKSKSSNPDLWIDQTRFVDVKTPESLDSFTRLANKASKQGAEACISDYTYKFTLEEASQKAIDIFNNKNKGEYTYQQREIHFIIKGKVETISNPNYKKK